MALVYVEDLHPGMVLKSHLCSPSGRLILAGGSPLYESALNALSTWGVIEADIDEATFSPEYGNKQRLLKPFKDRAEKILARRLAFNNIRNEPFATLMRHLIHRDACRLQAGRSETVLSPVIAPATKRENPVPLNLPQLISGVSELFSIPLVFSQIVELLNDDTLSVAKLAQVFDKDPGLSVKLLRMVNSPHYGLSNKVDSIQRAISLLGTDELRKLSLGRSLIKDFSDLPAGLLDPEQFWRHSIRCGLFAKNLAEMTGADHPQQYFTGGLLHDIGRLTMIERMPELYYAAVIQARQQQQSMHRAEQEILKLDHALVGQFLGERWGLDTPLLRMIAGHHSPRLANYSQESCIMHVADIFAHVSGDELLLVESAPEVQSKAWQELSFPPAMIAPLLSRVAKEFKATMDTFFSSVDEPTTRVAES